MSEVYNNGKVIKPKIGQVWAFRGGPRHDIIKSIHPYARGGRTIYYIAWESGLMTLTTRELWKDWEYRGFFIKIKPRG